MTADEEALYRGMCAEPHADLPRLVFADWQQEHGQEAFAAAIRAECELYQLRFDRPELIAIPAQPPEVWEGIDDDAHRFELLDRVVAGSPKAKLSEQLKRVPKTRGQTQLPYSCRYLTWDARGNYHFRAVADTYGFKNRDAVVKHLRTVGSKIPLRTIIAYGELTPDDIRQWADLPELDRLDSLHLGLSPLIEHDFPILSEARNLTRLRELFVSAGDTVDWVRAVARGPAWANLQRLALHSEPISEWDSDPLVELGASDTLRGLRSLILDSFPITRRGVTALTRRPWPHLRHLSLTLLQPPAEPRETWDFLAERIANSGAFPELRAVEIRGGDITGTGGAKLLAAKKCPHLFAVSLIRQPIQEFPAKAFSGGATPRVVSFNGCEKLTATAMKDWLGSPAASRLTVLDLGHCNRASGTALRTLAARDELDVRALGFYEVNLPETDLTRFVRSPAGSRLVSLDLQGFADRPDSAKPLFAPDAVPNLRALRLVYISESRQTHAKWKKRFGKVLVR